MWHWQWLLLLYSLWGKAPENVLPIFFPWIVKNTGKTLAHAQVLQPLPPRLCSSCSSDVIGGRTAAKMKVSYLLFTVALAATATAWKAVLWVFTAAGPSLCWLQLLCRELGPSFLPRHLWLQYKEHHPRCWLLLLHSVQGAIRQYQWRLDGLARAAHDKRNLKCYCVVWARGAVPATCSAVVLTTCSQRLSLWALAWGSLSNTDGLKLLHWTPVGQVVSVETRRWGR